MTRADLVLRWLFRASLFPAEREYVVGDLEEGVAAMRRLRGERAARAWWRKQIVFSLVPNVRRRLRVRETPAAKGDPVFTSVMQDVRYAIRALKKTPAVTTAAALSLALGIGATSAVFSVINGVMLRPLTYPDAHRLMLLSERNANGEPMSVAWQNFQDWSRDQKSFAAFGIYRSGTANLTGGDRPDRVSVAWGSSTMFTAAGIEPRLGRRFTAQEDIPGAPRVAVISERLWQNRLGSEPAVLGRDIVLNGDRYSVIGVMPSGMRFPSRTTDVWLPFGAIAGQLPASRGNHPNLWVIGRLRDDVDMRQAQTEMDAIAGRLGEQFPESNHGSSIAVESLYEGVVRNVRPALYLLLAVVSCVLLIACGNVANLLLAKGERRHRELAVRAALGATRGRIVRQLLTEQLVLAAGSGVCGLALAFGGLRALVASAPSFLPRVDQIRIDPMVLAFTAAASILTGVMIGAAPALRASGWRLGASAKDVGRGRSRSAVAIQGSLVVFQVAVALTLLASAGLLVRSFSKLMAVELGFATDNVVTMRVDLPTVKYPELPQWTGFHERLLEAVSAVPSIQHAALGTAVPLGGSGSESAVIAEGQPLPKADERPAGCTFVSVSGGYFAALGMPLLQGRTFSHLDRDGAPPVAIVDQGLVNLLFRGQDPLGKRIAFELLGDRTDPKPIWREIVGIVPHVQYYGVASTSPRVQVYVPHTQIPAYNRGPRRPGLMVIARTPLPPENVAASVRAAAARIDPDLPIYAVTTLTAFVDQHIEQPRFTAVLVAAFSGLALLLSAIGIYGVLSYSVTTRTQEMGLRMALGATAADIRRLVLRQGLTLTAMGLGLGSVGAIAAGRLLRQQLFQVSPVDPVGLGAVSIVLFIVAAAATYVPARRGTRIDPAIALRTD
jgi:putative ABC transport system permease protein